MSLSDEARIDGYAVAGVVTGKPKHQSVPKQGLPNVEGISGETAGTRGSCMHLG